MKVLLVGERHTLNQRLAQLFERQGFTVLEVAFKEEAVELLAKEPIDVMLVIAPEEDAGGAEVVAATRGIRPSTHVYLLTQDGLLSQPNQRVHPVLGTKVSVNDLPTVMREEVARSESEREYLRLEWLQYAEDLVTKVGEAQTLREAGKRMVEQIQVFFECRGCALALNLDPSKPPETVAEAGDAGPATQTWKDSKAISQWLAENQAPLVIRRGRSAIPGIQRDVVKLGLGSCVCVPIATTQRMVGVLTAERAPNAEPFSESTLAVIRIAAKAFGQRLETDQAITADELRNLLQREREVTQTLEDGLAAQSETTRRLAGEIATIIDTRTGHRPGRSETIAKLSVSLAEQLDLKTDYLQEAVYLRDIGMLAGSERVFPELQPVAAAGVLGEHARMGFEVLSRSRLPSPCLEVARHHHENYDGSGVPDGLMGEEISALARVVRIVEDYVNMTASANGGQLGASPIALAHLAKESGKSYDPRFSDTFVKLIRARGITPEQETLSLIAHELRTPLTFLLGFSELLAARKDLPNQAQEMATDLHKQTEQMVTLTERLLEISRLQAGRVSLTRQWVDLNALIEDQVTKSRALSDRHTVGFQAPPYPVRVRIDATRIGQAVSNLLSNAIKYSPKGGQVLVTLEETSDEVVVHVTDQGVGIPKEKIDRLFQTFYRVELPETAKVEGLGLGLALTRAMVEAHGGRIWVVSELGKGSEFRFSLPKQGVQDERRVSVAAAER